MPSLEHVSMPPRPAPEGLSVWLAHDWLTGMRGGEKVLLELVRLFPQARIATLFYVPGAVDPEIEKRIAAVSVLQRLPGIQRNYRRLLPILPWAVRTIRIPSCDLVISVSHCVAKGVPIPAGTPHLCYCLTPMRYIWNMRDHYVGNAGPAERSSGGLAQRLALTAFTPRLRAADLANNAGVTAFLANSNNVARRIETIYHRPATTVYSPIDDAFYGPSGEPPEDFYLVVSALVPYKRVDLIVRAFMKDTRGRRVVIIGIGPESARLKALASGAPPGKITFLGWADDAAVRSHYQRCRALVFPGEEDFGLVPLEVQACGRPVIAYSKGGILETVIPLESATADAPPTGVFFQEQTEESLLAALDRFEQNETAFNPSALAKHARRFGVARFREGILAAVDRLDIASR